MRNNRLLLRLIGLALMVTLRLIYHDELLAGESEIAANTLADEEQPLKRLIIVSCPFYNDTIGAGVGLAEVIMGMKPSSLYTRMNKLGIPTSQNKDAIPT